MTYTCINDEIQHEKSYTRYKKKRSLELISNSVNESSRAFKQKVISIGNHSIEVIKWTVWNVGKADLGEINRRQE